MHIPAGHRAEVRRSPERKRRSRCVCVWLLSSSRVLMCSGRPRQSIRVLGSRSHGPHRRVLGRGGQHHRRACHRQVEHGQQPSESPHRDLVPRLGQRVLQDLHRKDHSRPDEGVWLRVNGRLFRQERLKEVRVLGFVQHTLAKSPFLLRKRKGRLSRRRVVMQQME